MPRPQMDAEDWCAGYTQNEFLQLTLENRLSLAFDEVAPMTYGGVPAWPRWRPGIPTQYVQPVKYLSPGYGILCSSMTAYLLPTILPQCPWDDTTYGMIQVFEQYIPDQPFSPCEAAVMVGAGRAYVDGYAVDESVEEQFEEGDVILAQGWRKRYTSGHAVLWEIGPVLPNGDRRIFLYESTNANNNIGPRQKGTTLAEELAEFKEGLGLALLRPGSRSPSA